MLPPDFSNQPTNSKYLSAHGEVSSKDKVTHHVFPGEPGSSLLAGKLNGNRSYVVDLKVPMGSYHIIDGEKVSVRYAGQEWTCARCHQYKKDCPGAAVARDCTASRILLSAHMAEHWARIGYKPETDALNEVDQTAEPEVQVGGRDKNKLIITESSLTSKYKAVIIKGFRTDTPLEDILEILLGQGLPTGYSKEGITRNDKTGHLSVENLNPVDCLALSANMNSKRFLSRQIHVTSVVADSPTKSPPANKLSPSSSGSSTGPAQAVQIQSSLKPLPPNLGTLLIPKPSPTANNSPAGIDDSSVAKSPSVQEKINLLESKDMTPLNFKRKSEGSPETDLSRKEKRIQRETEKKQRKIQKKEESRQNRSLENI